MTDPVTIYGAGSWGTTLALVLADKGVPVLLWAQDPVQREEMTGRRENRKYLPGIPFPGFIHVIPEGSPPAPRGEFAVIAVPSHGVRNLVRAIPKADRALGGGTTWVIATKGLEEGSGLRMSEVVRAECGADGHAAGGPDTWAGIHPDGGADARAGIHADIGADTQAATGSDSPADKHAPTRAGTHAIVTLAGPSLAREVSEGQPTALLAASDSEAAAARVQDLFSTERFRVYRSLDPVGVELATSLKNGIAIAAGIADGLGLGGNALGALVTRGLAEITRLGVALGAQMETFLGLAGVGDLVTTCTSRSSRNHELGRLLSTGLSLEAALGKMSMVAEGVKTTRVAVELAAREGVEVPILAQVERILFHGLDPAEAIETLMTRPLRAE